jgi:hydroxymethylbilane synthase
VGTGSPRRAAALRGVRDDLVVADIRGNVDTRLGMVADGLLDAVLLACAGLARLERESAITERVDPQVMMPAPGQGALAVEAREDAALDLAEALLGLDDGATRAAVTAERGLLAALEVGCSAPVGALAAVDGSTVTVTAAVYSRDGGPPLSGHHHGHLDDAVEVGRHLALTLLTDGAAPAASPYTEERAQ